MDFWLFFFSVPTIVAMAIMTRSDGEKFFKKWIVFSLLGYAIVAVLILIKWL